MERKVLFAAAISVLAVAPVARAADDATSAARLSDGNGGVSTTVTNDASPGELSLSTQDQEAIRSALMSENTRQRTPEKFEAHPGGAVPTSIHLNALPRPLVYQLPALKRYMYASLSKAAIIVDPMQKRIVAVLPLPASEGEPSDNAGKNRVAMAALAGLPNLEAKDRHEVYVALAVAENVRAQPVPAEAMLAGSKLPHSLTWEPVPDALATKFPPISSLQFAKLEDGRVILADPGADKVAGIITADDGREPGARAAKSGSSESKGQAPGAVAADSIPGGGSPGSGGAMQ